MPRKRLEEDDSSIEKEPDCRYWDPAGYAFESNNNSNKKKKISDDEHVNLFERKSLFKEHWNQIEKNLDSQIEYLSNRNAKELLNFKEKLNDKFMIPTALITSNLFRKSELIIEDLKKLPNFFLNENNTFCIELNQWDNSIEKVNRRFLLEFNKIINETTSKIEDVLEMLIEKNSKKSSTEISKLIIIIHDLENFEREILQSLVSSLKRFVGKLPIGFILFQRNGLNVSLENYLPNSICKVELIENSFKKEDIISCLEKIVLSDIRLKFHPRIIEQLMEDFEISEFSIENFRNTIKFYVFNYFYSNPLSSICSYKKMLLSNENRILNRFRNSIKFPKNCSVPKTNKEFVDFLLERYNALLGKNESFIKNINDLLKLFEELKIPTNNILYYYAKFYNENPNILIDELKSVTQSKMFSALDKLLSSFPQSDNGLPKIFHDNYEKLKMIVEKNKKEEKSINNFKTLNFSSRQDWQQSMKPNSKKEGYEQWKTQFLKEIKNFFLNDPFLKENYLVDPLFNCPDISYISSRENFKQFKTTKKPKASLNSENINNYSFHLLSRMFQQDSRVDLNDWFEDFREQKRKTNQNISDEELVVMFINAIQDLVWLGLLKCSHSYNKNTVKYTKLVVI